MTEDALPGIRSATGYLARQDDPVHFSEEMLAGLVGQTTTGSWDGEPAGLFEIVGARVKDGWIVVDIVPAGTVDV